MARCCGGGCSCKIEGGSNITLSGVGSASDPFVVSTDLGLQALDTDVFDVNITGNGTVLSPWVVSVNYGVGAQLDDIPDVNAPSPSNAQVLGWDSATSRWTPRAPTTASAGAVQHDTSLTGDGSAGSPLQVSEASEGGLTTTAGLGLTDDVKNRLIRKFADSTTRAAASPAPTLNTLSELDTNPGFIDYWTGSQWLPVKSTVSVDATNAQLLQLSGGYISGVPVTMMVRKFTGNTAADGTLTVLANSEISMRAGVLSAQVTVTGSQAYLPVVSTGNNYVYITARRVDDGAVLANQSISGQITAYVY